MDAEGTVNAAAAMSACLVLGLVWLSTGRDPLKWLIWSLVMLRAAIAQAGEEIWRAVCRWWAALPEAIERSRQECLGGGRHAGD